MHQHVSWLKTLRTTICGLLLTAGILRGQQEAKSAEPTGKGDLNSIVANELRAEAVAEMKIRKALLEPTSIEFIETPLIDFLQEQHGIQIEVATTALDASGLGSDTPVTRDLKGITLRAALNIMLKDLELTYVIQDEILQITTYEDAEQNAVTRIYDVDDLLADDQSVDDLIDAVTVGCLGEVYVHSHGVSSSVVAFRGRLIVTAPYYHQEKVARMLALLRATQSKREAKCVQNSLGLFPLSDEASVVSKAPLRDERVKIPKPSGIADPFGEGVPAPRKPKASPKPARDPFGGGGGADPFGGGGGGEDPFGGDTDPPGVGGTDPFGKDADPFK